MTDQPQLMEGYKPVIHKNCDQQCAWIKENVFPGMRMQSEDVRLMDGSQPPMGSRLGDCPYCGVSMGAGGGLNIA